VKYFPIPVALLEIGKPLPVDVWSSTGNLLLRKGQPVVSEQHREKLHAHQASSTLADALAWQRSYERMVHVMLRDGVEMQAISRASMPSEIRETDYVVGESVSGGWLDLQEVLRGILYQGGLAINPLRRLAGIEKKAAELLLADPDDSLFCLFQALADETLGYCATHALLCAVVCQLTAEKLGLAPTLVQPLVRAALTMNIGMARDQDSMARQNSAPTDWQRQLIREHPEKSVAILAGFGIDDAEQLDIVRWHHADDSPEGLAHTHASRQLLALADGFVARMAARKTRSPLSPVKAIRSMVLGAEGDAIGVGSAMAQAVGFYPPGSYVLLANGDVAVAVQRGARANTPWVISIVNKDGMPIATYRPKDTATPAYAIESPVDFETVRVTVNLDKVRKARAGIPR
jgi:HD-GYP domain-containing protein (c-di-GMP phosphodiesterase class II)